MRLIDGSPYFLFTCAIRLYFFLSLYLYLCMCEAWTAQSVTCIPVMRRQWENSDKRRDIDTGAHTDMRQTDRQTYSETHCDRQAEREIDRIEQYGDSDCGSDICRLGSDNLFFRLSLCVSVYLHVPPLYLSVFLSTCLSMYQSVCLSVFTCISVSVYLSLFACCISLSMPSYSISMCT